ncbi:MAG: hypothetical protein QOJ07_183 [Thermoleophilaceae bacterium]|nr:hypothetical protein [Thermoleophilaceae bacterium]
MPPTYRERLRIEGAWLVAVGAAGSAALLATTDEARRWPLNTAGQLVLAAGAVAYFGPRGARKAMDESVELQPGAVGSGEPTPLWMHPLIVGGFAAVFPVASEAGVKLAGYDACLRVTIGSMIVGLGQAVLIERIVARAEREQNRRYFRIVGSRGASTRLGWLPGATDK